MPKFPKGSQEAKDYMASIRKKRKPKQEKKCSCEGGSLSTGDFKGLIDASYDPKIKQVGDFVLDPEISSKTSKVFDNIKTDQAVVAHRGTQGIADWGNNAVFAIGGKEAYKKTARFKEAQKVQRKAEAKYGAKNVTTIGHSQGGLQSEILGSKSKETLTLNKATRPFSTKKGKNQTDVRTERDVVSALNPFGDKSKKDINIKSESYNPLTEHSTDVLNRLDKDKLIGEGIAIHRPPKKIVGRGGRSSKVSPMPPVAIPIIQAETAIEPENDMFGRVGSVIEPVVAERVTEIPSARVYLTPPTAEMIREMERIQKLIHKNQTDLELVRQKIITSLHFERLFGGIYNSSEDRAIERTILAEIARLNDKYTRLLTTNEITEGFAGSGIKRKFAKGSQEAKDFMKSLRDKRKN